MKYAWVIGCCFLLLQACGNKNEIPPRIIPRDKMETILWDLMRADQYLGSYVFNRDSSKNKTTESLLYYDRIFRLHNISRDQFLESFSWYRFHPTVFKEIMDSISTPAPGVIPMPVSNVPIPDTVKKLTLPRPDSGGRKKTFIPLD